MPSFIPHCFELEQHAHVSEGDIPLQLHLEFPEIQELGYEYTITYVVNFFLPSQSQEPITG